MNNNDIDNHVERDIDGLHRDTSFPGNVYSDPEIRVERTSNGEDKENEYENPVKKQKKVRLLLDARTELTDEELKVLFFDSEGNLGQ